MVSCHRHYQYPPVLQEADSLCVDNPDSAVSLLRAIAGDMQQEPMYVQKRYHLLTIKVTTRHTSPILLTALSSRSLIIMNTVEIKPALVRRITMPAVPIAT